MLVHTQEFPIVGAADVRVVRPRIAAALVAAIALAAGMLAALAVRDASVPTTDTRATPRVAAPAAGAFVSVDRRLSHHGRYRAAVVEMPAPAVGVPQAWTVRLTRRDHRRASRAAVTVRAWMPETGLESPVRATVRRGRDGRYRVAPIVLAWPGWWNVALVVDGAAGVDSVAFNVVVP